MRILVTGAGGRTMRRSIWTPETWNDGYIDNRGRFRVFRPDFPRAYALGYCLRAHVVWWLHTGVIHPKGTVLHHKDEIKIHDEFENLELMEHGKHTSLHARRPVIKRCARCENEFEVQRRRTKKYCSFDCYSKIPHALSHKKNISDGLRKAYKEGRR